MNWNVRIRLIGKPVRDALDIETFLEGVFTGLVAAEHRVELHYGDGLVDVEFYVSTERRAVLLAKVLADALKRHFPRTKFQITLTVDVCHVVTGGAA